MLHKVNSHPFNSIKGEPAVFLLISQYSRRIKKRTQNISVTAVIACLHQKFSVSIMVK